VNNREVFKLLKVSLYFLIIGVFSLQSTAQFKDIKLPPNIPNIDPEDIEKEVVKIPIKNEEGLYDLVDVIYDKSGGTQTITVPNYGDITLITDKDGNFDLTITPEEIKGSDNMNCSVSPLAKTTKCTVTPLYVVDNNKVYSADKAEFSYKEGEDTSKLDITSNNLVITGEDEQTHIKKNQTDLGNTNISLNIKGANKDGFLLGVIPSLDAGDSDPKNLESITISATASTLTHSVTNPKNPSDERTKLHIPGGVSTSIATAQDSNGNLSVIAAGKLNGPVTYDSDPFSDNKVTAKSNGSANFQLSFTEQGKKSNGTLVLATDATNSDGKKSELELTDTSDKGVTNTVKTEGATSIIINQEFTNNNGKREPGDTDLAIATESLTLSNKEGDSTKTYNLTNAEVTGKGNKNDNSAQFNAKAENLKISDDGKKGFNFNLFGNVNASAIANNEKEAATVDADHVVFSNKDIDVNADGNVRVSFEKEKNPTKKIGDKSITSEIFAKADSIKVEDDKTKGQLTGGNFYQATLDDGSTHLVAYAQSGNLTSDNSQINFNDGAQLVTSYDKDGKIKASNISSKDLKGTYKDTNSVSIQDSSTTVLSSKDSKGSDLTKILHSSSAFDVNNEDQSVNTKDLKITASYTDDVKYGQVEFSELTAKDNELDGKVSVKNATVLFYNDESKNKPQREASFTAEDLKYDSKDIGLNISAIGKDGKKEDFTIYYLEKDGETIVQVFNKDGNKVKIDGSDKDKNFGDILFKSAQYYKNDKFTSFVLEEASGNIRSIDEKSNISGNFSAAKITGYQESDGSFSQYYFEGGNLDLIDPEEGNQASLSASSGTHQEENKDGNSSQAFQLKEASFEGLSNEIKVFAGFDQLDFNQQSSQNTNQTSFAIKNGTELRLESTKKDQPYNATLIGFDAYGVQKDSIKYGTLDFKEAIFEEKGKTPKDIETRIKLTDGSVMFYETEEDQPFKYAKLSTAAIGASNKDFKLNISAIGDDGTPGKFTMFFLEEGNEKNVRVYDESGKLIKISGSDKDSNFGDILFRTANYYENEDIKTFMVDELKLRANINSFESGNENVVLDFNAARLGGTELKDGSFRQISAKDLFLTQTDKSNNSIAGLSIGDASFTETNYLGTIGQNIQAYDGTINYTQYKNGKLSGNPKLDSKVSFGSLVTSSVEDPKGKKLTYLKVNDVDLLATDYDNMLKVSGKVGEASYLDSDQVQVIDIKDLEKLQLSSLDKDIDGVFNGKQFLKVDTKDGAGKVTKSYLLIRDGDGEINAKDDKITAKVNFNARVFEFVRDEVTGQNLIVRADADFKAKASFDAGIANVSAKVSGAIKGENISTSSSSFKSADGKRSGGQINIHAEKLEKLHLKAEVGFIDLIELKAEGKNGQSINYSYEIDKSQGVIKLRGVYKNGDKLETKFLFFKLKSHKEGDDAVSALKLKLKGQSIQDHMAILSEMASVRQINDFFGVSDGGAITFTAGAKDKGFAMELMMVDERFAFRAPNSFKTFHRPTNSYGLAIKYITDDDTTWGVQTALTSDSRIEVEGDLEAFGTKVESIPTTANLNVTFLNKDKDLSVVGGVHMPLTSSLVDKDLLDKDAQFFDGGTRKANGPGAHLAVTKKFDNSELKFTAGMYDNFSEPVVHLTYQGSPQVLGRLGKGIINLAEGEPFDQAFRKPAQGMSNYEKQKRRQKFIKDEEIREMEAKRMTVLEKKIEKLKKYYADKPGFNRIKEILKIAEEYLNSRPDRSDTRKDIFRYTVKDRAVFSYYEDDQSKVEDIDAIVLGIIENRILVQLPIEDKAKDMMLDIYRKRRYYEIIKSTDQLGLINESGLSPCEFYLKGHSES